MNNYVYLITNITNDIKYIGVRSCRCDPIDDINYWSSSKYVKEAITEHGINNFTKSIIVVFDTREEAVNEEIRLHKLYDVAINENYYNKAIQTSTSFDTSGVDFNGTRRIENSDGETSYTLATKKIKSKMSMIGYDGLTGYQRAGKNGSITKNTVMSSGLTNAQESGMKAHKTLSTVGDNGLTIYQEIGIKNSNTVTEIVNGSSIAIERAKKIG